MRSVLVRDFPHKVLPPAAGGGRERHFVPSVFLLVMFLNERSDWSKIGIDEVRKKV